MKKLVLAYSGGLDTSYCVKYLSENGYEVHAVSVNTGGFSEDELAAMEEKAHKLGAASVVSIDAQQTYYEKVIKYLLFGNVLKNNTYPLSVSAERIVQATELIKYAKNIGAQYIAHGSTGAGNDQVRFDTIFQVMAPEIEVITPIRDHQLSRQEEVAYLEGKGIKMEWTKAKYSINKGLWGTSVGGDETLTSHLALPEEAYPNQLIKNDPEKISIGFEGGEPVSLNGKTMDPVQLIKSLEKMASGYAIGRDIHVGDTIIGIKGRVGFEAAAPLLLIKAHHLLEKHVLSKWQQHHKEYLSSQYGMLLHEGQYLDPFMRNAESFLEDTQNNVNGTVYVTLHPYRFTLDGITSENDLMHPEFGSYGEMNSGWSAAEAKGFIKINAQAQKIQHNVNPVTI
ncbi:argininosuccinate synthase [Robertkochia marina]|uniref:argininosuccinate synthase n=1 Tax=Robertkochia marina TaxID=1227945 RepID=A0A4S3M2G2_9FLAO|nr:argininosuccinate synthase [Robertkochia marina]THD67665.1 argininosuccinate synthase [Robertkochia marina]TRZ43397.1 argininosuccinate synthase [Robertkochia marina]